jgi:hypothetical protein
VIGRSPNEHGEKEVHRPAVYSNGSDFTVDASPLITVLANVDAAFCVLKIISSNPD